MSPPRRVCVVAGEPSGDQLAAAVVRGLAPRWPGVAWSGLAGPRMREAGVAPVAQVEDVSVMGVVEVLRHLPRIWRIRRALARHLASEEIDLAVFVDAPELCLPLARTARSQGIRTVVIGSPQLWAWRPGRAPSVLAAADALLCLFAFEPPLYAAHAAPDQVHFVGHPAVDGHAPGHGLLAPPPAGITPPEESDHWAVLPGSRPQELRRHLGPFQATTRALQALRPRARFTWVVPPALAPSLPTALTVAPHLDALGPVRGALTKSGTITLQLAARRIPQVVAHRVHPLTHWLARRLVRGVAHIALPNILDPARPVPEFVQHLDPATLATALHQLPLHQPVDLGPAHGPQAVGRMVEAAAGCWERR